MTMLRPLVIALAASMVAPTLAAQDMSWIDYTPRSSLVVPEHVPTHARFPFIDVHAHPRVRTKEALDQLVADMDAMNMGLMVNLSGGTGDRLKQTVELMVGNYPNRFVVFANLDYSGIDDPNWSERAAERLAEDFANGAAGLKIFKNHGMTVQDGEGGPRVPTDDPRFDPVWAKAGELGMPVLIHTADPHQFWQPHDQYNERWFELVERPRRIRPPDRFPPWEDLMQEQWNVIRKHPNTNFISAHLSWLGGDLDRLGALFDSLPNMYTGLGAVLAELGRQPARAREFLTKYQDRVVFGKDAWGVSEYHTYFRTLETADEYFDYYRRRHAFWKLYGLALPDSVLQKVYYENAIRLIPTMDHSRFPPLVTPLPYGDMAIQIMAALDAGGDRVILRYDPATYPRLAASVAQAAKLDGAEIEFMPYGEVPQFEERLALANVYVWLPAGENAVTTPEQAAALGRWLDEGRGRQVHFHWNGGTQGLDGIMGAHSPTYDSIYMAALSIDYAALDAAQSQAIQILRSGEIHVTTPAGTDLRFSVGDRPFNKQNGDASRAAMANARTRIDREIELPAGVIRVAPLEQTVNGTLVVPWARFDGATVRGLRLTIVNGAITDIEAEEGVDVMRDAIKTQPALRYFREIAIGFNPRLLKPEYEPWLPYYGYGAGTVRLSLGNNEEIGGVVAGTGVRWFFFDDATVIVDGAPIVADGRLEIH